MNPTHRSDFAYKVWMAAGALVTAVITTFLLLAFLSPEISVQLPRGQSGAMNGD